MDIYFSGYFGVSRKVVERYGALDISLVSDLPLFIDPFLLFNSNKPKYRLLHRQIIEYLEFLRDQAENQQLSNGLISRWYRFPEAKQNWLGFSVSGNQGAGLGKDFASSLYRNLNKLFSDFGNEEVTKSSHLEKLCLIEDGRDKISDFTTNLIKEFLLNYTQTFAQKYIDRALRKKIAVDRVRFNYETESGNEASMICFG